MLDALGSVPVTIIAFVFGLSLLVFIHEYGHYGVARLFGTKVDSFSIGFGPEIFGWNDKRGVRWKLCALPLGGYVKFAGDEDATSGRQKDMSHLPDAEKKQYFQFKPLWQRACIVVAGPVVNLVAPIFVFAFFAFTFGVIDNPAIIGEVFGKPAQDAGLQPGDKIIEIDGSSVERFNDLADLVRLMPDEQTKITVIREGERLTRDITIGRDVLTDLNGVETAIGVLGISHRPVRRPVGFLEAAGEGVRQTQRTVGLMLRALGQLVSGKRSLQELSGPPRIAQMMGKALNTGLDQFALILALLSLNLGIVNLLPIPSLDGGHLFLYSIEAIKGSPIPERTQEWAMMACMALIFAFMALVTLNDLQIMFL